MFFPLTKIVGFMLDPLHLPLFLVAFAFLLRSLSRNISKFLIACALAWVMLLGVVPFWQWGLQSLENQYAYPDPMPSQIGGIIVLGGAMESGSVGASRPFPPVGSSGERLFASLQLAQRYPNVPIVFSGYSGSLWSVEADEASLTRSLIHDLIKNPQRVMYENKSRNTYENAVFTEKLLMDLKHTQTNAPFLLVTSAGHMPRSMALFARTSIPVVAYPVDYVSPQTGTAYDIRYDLKWGADLADRLLHEILGLIGYRLSGKI
ncbi:MAG: YdcF family protein [Alphaproteobacteria bacterium]